MQLRKRCQGETDADSNRGAATWKNNVTKLFADLKANTPITDMLTYTEEINIPYDVADEYAMPHEITLICGDIDSDGYIKIPDRSHLIEMLNHPSRNALNTTEFDLCDLNGDSRINLSDLNILKSNINRTYS